MNVEPIKLERMFGALLRIPYQAMRHHVEESLAAAGYDDVRIAHFNVFQHLPAEGGRLTDLAESAQITKQSMSVLIGHLVAGGYLEQIQDPTDRRVRIVRRTERGWEVERIARSSIKELEDEWSERLGRERMQAGRAFLEDLAALIEES